MTNYLLLIKKPLFDKLMTADFSEGVYIIGARELEPPKIKKPEPEVKPRKVFIKSSIVSQRLRKMSQKKTKPTQRKGLIQYLISDARLVKVKPDEMDLVIDKEGLSEVLINYYNNGLKYFGLTYFDIDKLRNNYPSERAFTKSGYGKITNISTDLLQMNLQALLKTKSIDLFPESVIIYQGDNELTGKLMLSDKSIKLPINVYVPPKKKTPYDLFFEEPLNKEGFNEFFKQPSDMKAYNEFFS